MKQKFAVLLAVLILVVGIMPAAAQGDMAQAHKEAIRSAMTNFSSSNIDAYLNLFPEQYKMNQGDITLADQPRAATEGFIKAITGAIPDIKLTPSFLVAQGDWVAAEMVFNGTFSQPFSFPMISPDSFPPTNKPVQWSEMDFFHFNDAGLVDEVWAMGDPTVQFGQMGIIPAQDTASNPPDGTPLDSPAGYQALSADDLAATFTSGMEARNAKSFTDQMGMGIMHMADNQTDPIVNWTSGKAYSVTAAETQNNAPFFQLISQAMPDMALTPDPVVAEGDWVAGVVIFKGTFTQDVTFFDGRTLTHTDQPIGWGMGFAGRYNADGQFVEQWSEGDIYPLVQGLGVVPAGQ